MTRLELFALENRALVVADRRGLVTNLRRAAEHFGVDSGAWRGELLEVLPSVGYTEARLDPGFGRDGETLWFVVYRPDPVSFPGRWLSAVEDGSPTKAEALVAALEAAP